MAKGLAALLSGALTLMPPQSLGHLIMLESRSQSVSIQQKPPEPITKRHVDSVMQKFIGGLFKEQDEGRSYTDQLETDDDPDRLITIYKDGFTEGDSCFATKIRLNRDGSIDYEVIANRLLLYGSLHNGLAGIKVFSKPCNFDFKRQEGQIQDLYLGFSQSHPLLSEMWDAAYTAHDVFHFKKAHPTSLKEVYLPKYLQSENVLIGKIMTSD